MRGFTAGLQVEFHIKKPFFSVYYVRACSANTLWRLHTHTHKHTKYEVERVVSRVIHELIKLFPQVILIPDRRHRVLLEEKAEMCTISMW